MVNVARGTCFDRLSASGKKKVQVAGRTHLCIATNIRSIAPETIDEALTV